MASVYWPPPPFLLLFRTLSCWHGTFILWGDPREPRVCGRAHGLFLAHHDWTFTSVDKIALGMWPRHPKKGHQNITSSVLTGSDILVVAPSLSHSLYVRLLVRGSPWPLPLDVFGYGIVHACYPDWWTSPSTRESHQGNYSTVDDVVLYPFGRSMPLPTNEFFSIHIIDRGLQEGRLSPPPAAILYVFCSLRPYYGHCFSRQRICAAET